MEIIAVNGSPRKNRNTHTPLRERCAVRGGPRPVFERIGGCDGLVFGSPICLGEGHRNDARLSRTAGISVYFV